MYKRNAERNKCFLKQLVQKHIQNAWIEVHSNAAKRRTERLTVRIENSLKKRPPSVGKGCENEIPNQNTSRRSRSTPIDRTPVAFVWFSGTRPRRNGAECGRVFRARFVFLECDHRPILLHTPNGLLLGKEWAKQIGRNFHRRCIFLPSLKVVLQNDEFEWLKAEFSFHGKVNPLSSNLTHTHTRARRHPSHCHPIRCRLPEYDSKVWRITHTAAIGVFLLRSGVTATKTFSSAVCLPREIIFFFFSCFFFAQHAKETLNIVLSVWELVVVSFAARRTGGSYVPLRCTRLYNESIDRVCLLTFADSIITTRTEGSC